MTTNVAPFLANVPIGMIGSQPVYATAFFIRYLNQQILERIGGQTQLSNTELANEILGLQASEMTLQAPSSSDAPFDVSQGAGQDNYPQDIDQGVDMSALGDTTYQS